MTDFSPLRARISSPVFEPGDTGFAAELSGFNLNFVHSPEAVVGATDATAIAETVRFARTAGLPVRVLATGHGSHESIVDGIVVTTRALDSVSVDPVARIATFGGGVRWTSVVASAAEHGLAPVTGAAASVGAVGYLLGGGVGPLARSHGFSSDWVRGFTVVTGTGELVEASALVNPDLFWALRGGKGGLGVVTEVRLELVELSEIYGGSILFDADHIETVLRAWVEFTGSAPADVTSSIAIMRMPPIDEVPPPLRGKTLLALRFAYPGDARTGERLIAPLRDAATPMMDMVGSMPLANVAMIHNDPSEPGPATSRGGLLRSIDQDFATTLLEIAGAEVELPLVSVEIRHIGSATRADVAGGSAVGGRGSDYTVNAVGMIAVPELAAPIDAAVSGLFSALEPWMAEETTINFSGTYASNAWPDDTLARLARVRATWDPSAVFTYGVLQAS